MIATDIEQSKKLAKILPIESADMYWLNRHIDLTETKYEVFIINKSNKYIDFFNSYAVAVDNNEIIPAWSLSALLELIPNPDIQKINGEWICSSYQDYSNSVKRISCNTSIDACYEMIIKLHEQKLI